MSDITAVYSGTNQHNNNNNNNINMVRDCWSVPSRGGKGLGPFALLSSWGFASYSSQEPADAPPQEVGLWHISLLRGIWAEILTLSLVSRGAGGSMQHAWDNPTGALIRMVAAAPQDPSASRSGQPCRAFGIVYPCCRYPCTLVLAERSIPGGLVLSTW